MKAIKSLKRKIGVTLNNSILFSILNKLNLVVFHWDSRAHQVHFGNSDPDKKYMCIRPMDNTQGLLSIYFYVLNNVKWAIENDYIPYVDFESEKCQYFTGRIINGTKNAWEYYFKQPSLLNKDDIYTKKCVLMSGWSFNPKYKIHQITKEVNSLRSEPIKNISKLIGVKEDIYKIVDEKKQHLFNGSVLGVFMRGTDYVKMKPKGHAVQPSLEQVLNKVDEFLGKYHIDRIFVVTEDFDYYSALKEKYGNLIFCSDDYFVRGYEGENYIESSFDNDPYERGLNYIVRVLLLNECDYLITGITNGSLVSCCLNDKIYKDEYWFRLGDY